uniref:E-selectin n=1 Tax=Stegastes partitus TaxID=144197 RepID=A0A3B5AK36_9TELE
QPSLSLLFLLVLLVLLGQSRGAQAWTYNYSTGPNQRWLEARQWCQKHFTDMVGIQNREETEFLNKLLPSNPKYYWIGIHKVAGAWTWAGSNQNVPEEAQNWATSEPDNIAGQDCVEIYIKRETDSAKWNNEKCRNKKGTVCYADSCMQDSCSAHADCVETVGSFTCRCHPGFFGPRCDEATACKPLPDPAHGMTCSHPVAPYSYNSTCEFRCDDGYELTGDARMHCDHSGQWTASVPACTVIKCPAIISPATGSVTCVDAVEPFSFGSRCDFTCREGFYLTGDEALTCLASGRWSNATPTCTAKTCNPVQSPRHGSLSCSDPNAPFSFGSRCTETCDEGFLLNGTSSFECTSQGRWSREMPRCQARQCPLLAEAPRHGRMTCSHPDSPFSYGSVCSFECSEGFRLREAPAMTCNASGLWSQTPAAVQCATLRASSSSLSMNCSHPLGNFSFGSQCAFACEEGSSLNGSSVLLCSPTGLWTDSPPSCIGALTFPLFLKVTCDVGVLVAVFLLTSADQSFWLFLLLLPSFTLRYKEMHYETTKSVAPPDTCQQIQKEKGATEPGPSCRPHVLRPGWQQSSALTDT